MRITYTLQGNTDSSTDAMPHLHNSTIIMHYHDSLQLSCTGLCYWRSAVRRLRPSRVSAHAGGFLEQHPALCQLLLLSAPGDSLHRCQTHWWISQEACVSSDHCGCSHWALHLCVIHSQCNAGGQSRGCPAAASSYWRLWLTTT